MYILLRWAVNGLILLAITYLVPGVVVESFYYALVVVVILGLVNALIRPFAILMTLPINVLTLGLFTFVVNAFMFWFVSTIVKGFTVADFWSAFAGALVYAILSTAVSYIDTKAFGEKPIKS